MIEIKTVEFAGLEAATKAMRLPKKSNHLSDSGYDFDDKEWINYVPSSGEYFLGDKDYNLYERLCKAGSEHRKHIRQIIVWAEITLPIYLLSELDTYRTTPAPHVCTSTMHTLHKDGFSSKTIPFDCIDEFEKEFNDYCAFGNKLLEKYMETKDMRYFRGAKQILGGGFMHTIIMPFNYENLRTMYHQRKNHRLSEWHEFCKWCESLPYSEFITGENE